ncbi:hypothetical protein [Bacillus sp. NSP9.1]|uniref:hypothetical protein n=1 Tax=Bacillus sp. NSP9.1 TaxID=1071078 RepID=UPI00047883F5|nr:hypothetical protein [Bacillus sp. NSP9.1]QHZ45848.1 hypothetical protein M654_005715 [Bacillus sp. NSP9.1]
MTKDELEAIRQRVEAATESYWAADDSEWPGNENLRYWVNTHWDGVAAAVTKEDAEFIAHARQDIPTLLDHIAELNEIVSRCRCEECGDEVGDNWTEVGGVIYCGFCAGGDENADDR